MFKIILAIFGLCICVQSASAATVTLDFHGTINRTTGLTSPPLGPGEQVLTRHGDNVVLSFTFDDTQLPTRVIDGNRDTGLQYTSGSSTLYLERPDIKLNAVPGSFKFASAVKKPTGFTTAVPATFSAGYMRSTSDFSTQVPIFRQTPSGLVFEPRIANMKVTDFFVNGIKVPNGSITPTPNPVPLPATGLLLISGLLGLRAVRSKAI